MQNHPVHSASTESEVTAKAKDSGAQLIAGKWYAIGLEGETSEIDWGSAPIYCYEGDGVWSDDAGERVYAFWDSFLQMYVSTADVYMQQS